MLLVLLLLRLLVVLCSCPDLSALTDTCHYQPFLCQLGTRQCPICEKFLCFWSLQQQLLQQIHGASYMTNSMRNQNNIFDRHSVSGALWPVTCHDKVTCLSLSTAVPVLGFKNQIPPGHGQWITIEVSAYDTYLCSSIKIKQQFTDFASTPNETKT